MAGAAVTRGFAFGRDMPSDRSEWLGIDRSAEIDFDAVDGVTIKKLKSTGAATISVRCPDLAASA